MRTRRSGWAVLVLAGAVLLGGCSSSEPSAAPATSTTVTTVATADLTAFCSAFDDLAAGGGGSQAARTEAEWDENLALVQRIADAAPAEIAVQADAYVEMVGDRKALAAANGYVGTDDLPADARTAFITDHQDQQAQVNDLLGYAKANCAGAP
ncbi:MAG: hypothetical protein JWO68_3908, partial [Actinomycetia bacterium]|nr:hypothetical protein [Actinomycetes bacterium]